MREPVNESNLKECCGSLVLFFLSFLFSCKIVHMYSLSLSLGKTIQCIQVLNVVGKMAQNNTKDDDDDSGKILMWWWQDANVSSH